MGYMGFGMQSWIYGRKLRKPFLERGKVASFNALPNYSRTFKLKPTIKRNRKITGLITVSVIFFLGLFVYILGEKFFNYEKQYNQSISSYNINSKNKINQEAFSFLLKSGTHKLSINDLHGAYSEFILASKIEPKNEQLVNLLIETTHILCKDEISYCQALETFLNQ